MQIVILIVQTTRRTGQIINNLARSKEFTIREDIFLNNFVQCIAI